MALNREGFFEQAGLFIKYMRSKAPLPIWCRKPMPEREQVEGLSEVQQLAVNIIKGLKIKGIDPNSKEGRERAAQVMDDVRANYDWLN